MTGDSAMGQAQASRQSPLSDPNIPWSGAIALNGPPHSQCRGHSLPSIPEFIIERNENEGEDPEGAVHMRNQRTHHRSSALTAENFGIGN